MVCTACEKGLVALPSPSIQTANVGVRMNATLLRGKINGPAGLFPEASPQPGSFFFS